MSCNYSSLVCLINCLLSLCLEILNQIAKSMCISLCIAYAYSEPCLTSKMKHFEKIVKGLKPLTIFEKSSFLDV